MSRPFSFSEIYTSLKGGGIQKVAANGTAEALVAQSAGTSCRGVFLQALESNTGDVCVGGSDVDFTEATRVGVLVKKTATAPLFIPIDDLSKVFIDVGTNDDGVSYLPVVG